MYYEKSFMPLYYSGELVRAICLHDMLWWVLSDVCRVIGIGNASRAAARLDDDEKMTLTLSNSHSRQRGGAQKLILINEPGLYHLLLTSAKPEAQPFRRWVVAEVLPSVRKNGGYIMGQDSMDAGELADAADTFVLNILAEQGQRIQGLLAENAEQAALICEYEPKARYYDAVLGSQGAIAVSVIAKGYGRSAQWLNRYLHEKGVQYKRNGTWLLYQRYAKEGYTLTRPILCGSPYCKRLTYWTQKGRVFLYHFLMENGIMPLSEKMDVSRDIEDVEPPQIRSDWW